MPKCSSSGANGRSIFNETSGKLYRELSNTNIGTYLNSQFWVNAETHLYSIIPVPQKFIVGNIGHLIFVLRRSMT